MNPHHSNPLANRPGVNWLLAEVRRLHAGGGPGGTTLPAICPKSDRREPMEGVFPRAHVDQFIAAQSRRSV